MFAGLGGGTGNAAFIFKHLLKKRINSSLIHQIKNKIGSDFKLFFCNQGFLNNLESIINLKRSQKLFFVLMQPNIKCSSKEIYSRVKNYSKKIKLDKNKINTNSKFLSHITKNKNDLQSIVEKKYPNIKKILINIRNEKGCYFSRMTGSGSVCYGLFDNQINAKKALKNLKIKHPKFWSTFAKTV